MDAEKSALVSVGENTRVVKFTSASQIVSNKQKYPDMLHPTPEVELAMHTSKGQLS